MAWLVSMSNLGRGLAGALTTVIVAAGAVVSAQGTQGFVPATDIAKESLPATPLVYGAYGFVWVALTLYVFLLWRRIGRVERELADVSTKLASRK
jgi:CcmD family protein